jgi:glycosyltransferase involved in cell wall biosynthesis
MTTTLEQCHHVATAAEPLGVLLIGVLPLWADRGDAIHLREVAQALRARNIRPTVLCLPGPAGPPDTGLREVWVHVSRARFRFQVSWNIRATLAGVRAVRAGGIDVVYSRLDPGMIAGWLVARITGRPFVVEMNGLLTEDVKLYRPDRKLLSRVLVGITRVWESWMYRAAQAIVAAPGYAEYAHQQFRIAARKFCVTPLGVNLQLFHPRDRQACRRELGLPTAPIVGWMGTLAGWQGLATLVDAAARVRAGVPDARFLIVGDGPALEECRAQVAALGLGDTFIFTGRVPYEQVPVYLGASDICVATFPGNRGGRGTISALKTVSYLACGRPTVTSEMDEMARGIAGKGAGLAVPPDDPEALAAALTELLREDELTRAARGQRAAALVGYARSWDAAADLIAARLREVAR